ncbi:heavy metal-associated isoprenylated plant protein 7-like [Salvia splendens]|uniref:heavy metal-associated isoprenylated plant protein 7-like n=1 Tax=Salvia splendens TaxID=180675 RepID=UPI001C279503|nr:heavy metal-associated isoprenylated plant protein 7-like [Salvia splendens]
MIGIESTEVKLGNSQVTVKGVIEPKALADYVYKKIGKHAAIVKVDPEKKEEEKLNEEKKSDGEKSDANKPEEDGKESKSGEAATNNAPHVVVVPECYSE